MPVEVADLRVKTAHGGYQTARAIGCACVVMGVIAAALGTVEATGWRKNNDELVRLNQKLQGKIIDHTANHGADHRIWSRCLGQRRDLYVYLPPGFDPHRRYPIMLYLHSFGHDEQEFLEVACWIDSAIADGSLPPLIVAAPDGSVTGEPSFKAPPTFFLNTSLGDFEDYLLLDVFDFMAAHYPIRPERDAHILTGASMGGFAAYNLGIRYRNCFGIVVGLFPPLNLRWMNECGDYWAKFDPQHWAWRNCFDRPREPLGKFGYATVRVDQLVLPLFGSKEEAIVRVALNNPIELVERTHLCNGELQMYVGYGAHDEFNLAAQIESFLYYCKFRNIYVEVGYDPEGHHDLRTAARLFPGVVRWLGPRLARYNVPACNQPPCGPVLASARPYTAAPVRTTAPPRPQDAGLAPLGPSLLAPAPPYSQPNDNQAPVGGDMPLPPRDTLVPGGTELTPWGQ